MRADGTTAGQLPNHSPARGLRRTAITEDPTRLIHRDGLRATAFVAGQIKRVFPGGWSEFSDLLDDLYAGGKHKLARVCLNCRPDSKNFSVVGGVYTADTDHCPVCEAPINSLRNRFFSPDRLRAKYGEDPDFYGVALHDTNTGKLVGLVISIGSDGYEPPPGHEGRGTRVESVIILGPMRMHERAQRARFPRLERAVEVLRRALWLAALMCFMPRGQSALKRIGDRLSRWLLLQCPIVRRLGWSPFGMMAWVCMRSAKWRGYNVIFSRVPRSFRPTDLFGWLLKTFCRAKIVPCRDDPDRQVGWIRL